MVVVAPGDPAEAAAATQAVAAQDGPCYMRLGRAGEPNVHRRPVDLHLGKAIQIRDGNDLTLISTGGMLETADHVAERLRMAGMQARVLSMHTVRPLDVEAVLAAARETCAVFTIEEHSVTGGLGAPWPKFWLNRAGDPLRLRDSAFPQHSPPRPAARNIFEHSMAFRLTPWQRRSSRCWRSPVPEAPALRMTPTVWIWRKHIFS